MLEVVDHAFPVQKVHRDCEKVPIQRLCQRQILLPRRDLRNCDDFLKAYDLNCRDNDENVDMSCEHCCEEASYHEQCPYCARNEGRLLLLVL